MIEQIVCAVNVAVVAAVIIAAVPVAHRINNDRGW